MNMLRVVETVCALVRCDARTAAYHYHPRLSRVDNEIFAGDNIILIR